MTYVPPAKETRYHVEKGFPKDVVTLLAKAASKKFIMQLEYSKHARDRARKYGCMTQLPTHINWADCEVFEVGIVGGVLDKVVARTEFDRDNDIILILNAANRKVRTLWLNRKDDQHDSLDLSVYATP